MTTFIFHLLLVGLTAKYATPIPNSASAKAIGTSIQALSLAKSNTNNTIGMKMPPSAGAIPITSFLSAILSY